jgi:branched-subunit amino acid transport protein
VTDQWWLVAGVGLVAVLAKAAGPLLLGRRAVAPSAETALRVLPVAILSALAASQAFVVGGSILVDARIAGLLVAGLLVWLRVPVVAVVVASAAVAAGVRALGWGS